MGARTIVSGCGAIDPASMGDTVAATGAVFDLGIGRRTWDLANFVGGAYDDKTVVRPLGAKLVIFAQAGSVVTKANASINNRVNRKFTSHST